MGKGIIQWVNPHLIVWPCQKIANLESRLALGINHLGVNLPILYTTY